jgi:predicted Zn-dependent protease
VIRSFANLLLLAALLAPPAAVAAAQDDIDHLIPPGYQPEDAQDEQGLWMEFEEMEKQLNRSALLVHDAELNNYIQGIVCRVAGDYCNDFRVYVVRNPYFNASMTATGMMQVWTGLIVRSSSSSDIASVVGHEIAHYTRLHSLEGFRKLKSKMATAGFLDLGLAALTGVGGIAQATAALSYLAFNRGQETEADILGVRLVAEAGYDPHAAYRVWYKILAEEEAAVAKREEPGLFSRTHPNSEDRAAYLKTYVTTHYGPPDVEQAADRAFLDILNSHYLFLMEDQLDTNRYGRTQEILEQHTKIGVKPGLINYFYGEMYRQRGNEGDQDLAMDAYTSAIRTGSAPPEAFKNLGYLYLKKKRTAKAQELFRQYLDADPDASDRAMIEFYLEDEAQ